MARIRMFVSHKVRMAYMARKGLGSRKKNAICSVKGSRMIKCMQWKKLVCVKLVWIAKRFLWEGFEVHVFSRWLGINYQSIVLGKVD